MEMPGAPRALREQGRRSFGSFFPRPLQVNRMIAHERSRHFGETNPMHVPVRLCAKTATMNLVRNHSHWGAFFAEVEGGRVVGVRPFERDPDPSHLINAIPDG